MICTLFYTKYLVEKKITRLEAKDDKKAERVERMDE